VSHAERAAIVQGDRSVLLEVDHPAYEDARQVLARYAEIEKSPEHVHTYRVSDLSLWNAASAGAKADEIVEGLRRISRFELPHIVEHEIRDRLARFGVCELSDTPDPARLTLTVKDAFLRDRLRGERKVQALLEEAGEGGFTIATAHRGLLKQALLHLGYPVIDRARLVAGAPLPVRVRTEVFTPYPYQLASVGAFVEAGSHGVIVLPCGAGKTVVAMLAMAALSVRTLIITTGQEAASQWRRELLA
jgi:DNA excision repair protein ERCC-3